MAVFLRRPCISLSNSIPSVQASRKSLTLETKARASSETLLSGQQPISPGRQISLPPIYRSPTVPRSPPSPGCEPNFLKAYRPGPSPAYIGRLGLSFQGKIPPDERLPAVYQASRTHDYYPTPVSTAAGTPWYTSPKCGNSSIDKPTPQETFFPSFLRDSKEERGKAEKGSFQTLTRPHLQPLPPSRPRLSSHPYSPLPIRPDPNLLTYPSPGYYPFHPATRAGAFISSSASVSSSFCKAPRKRGKLF